MIPRNVPRKGSNIESLAQGFMVVIGSQPLAAQLMFSFYSVLHKGCHIKLKGHTMI